MRQEIINIYKFDELNEEQKKKACEIHRLYQEFHWSDEYRQSLQGFCDYFPVKVKKWSVDAYSSHFSMELTNDEAKNVKGIRLWKYLKNNLHIEKDCPFTGFCGDEGFLEPYREFIKNPHESVTLEILMMNCLKSGFSFWQEDMKQQETDEYIGDFLTVNEYEFLETGEKV